MSNSHKQVFRRLQNNFRPIAVAVIGVLVLALAIQFLLDYSRRTEPLQDAAGNFLQAVIEGDAATVRKYTWQTELEKNKLSQADIQLVLDELIVPRIKALGIDEKSISKATYAGQGNAYVILVKKGGDESAFGVSAYRVGGEPRSMLSAVLVGLWIKEELVSTGEPISRQLRRRAMLKGLKQDRAVLHKAGFQYLFEANPANGSVIDLPIDEYIKRYEYWLAHPGEESG